MQQQQPSHFISRLVEVRVLSASKREVYEKVLFTSSSDPNNNKNNNVLGSSSVFISSRFHYEFMCVRFVVVNAFSLLHLLPLQCKAEYRMKFRKGPPRLTRIETYHERRRRARRLCVTFLTSHKNSEIFQNEFSVR